MDNELEQVKSALAECEIVIERGMRSFIEVGNALLKIRNDRLYRGTHKTFDAYCRDRWGWREGYAHGQIKAAEIAQSFSAMVEKPENERQVRPLALLPPEDRETAWNIAVEHSETGKPTGLEVQRVVDTLRELRPPKTKEEIDLEKRLRQAEKELDLRHQQGLDRYIKFSKLIEAVKYIAYFQADSPRDFWSGVYSASAGRDFPEYARLARNFLADIDLENPSATPKGPKEVIDFKKKENPA